MTPKTADTPSKRVGRKIGYGIAIACNVALLVILNNVLDWGWFPWLTADLNRALPILNASLIASTVANAVYLFYEPPAFKAMAELCLLAISLAATVRLWRLFPFDFSAYDFAWGTLVRWLLGVALVGTCIGIVVQLVQLTRLARQAAGGSDKPAS
jgi:hypothetical protein